MPATSCCAGSPLVQIPGVVDLYTSTLERRGYGPTAIHAYCGAVEHFLAWSAPNADAVEIGEASIRRFVDEHLRGCDCPGRLQRGRVTALSALRHLLAILHAAGFLSLVRPSFPVCHQLGTGTLLRLCGRRLRARARHSDLTPAVDWPFPRSRLSNCGPCALPFGAKGHP